MAQLLLSSVPTPHVSPLPVLPARYYRYDINLTLVTYACNIVTGFTIALDLR